MTVVQLWCPHSIWIQALGYSILPQILKIGSLQNQKIDPKKIHFSLLLATQQTHCSWRSSHPWTILVPWVSAGRTLKLTISNYAHSIHSYQNSWQLKKLKNSLWTETLHELIIWRKFIKTTMFYKILLPHKSCCTNIYHNQDIILLCR